MIGLPLSLTRPILVILATVGIWLGSAANDQTGPYPTEDSVPASAFHPGVDYDGGTNLLITP